jgi:acyl-CoA reductase-like NAD-dependent aldehyde dehydrogenase
MNTAANLRESLPQGFTRHYINGEYVDSASGDTFDVYNPKDNSIVAKGVPVAGEADVDKAVACAEAAFKGPWSKFSSSQRTACILKLAELLEERLVEILTLDSLTTGNPVSLIPTRERTYIRNSLLYFGALFRSVLSC